MRQIVEVEKSTLIVAANVADIQERYAGILDFVLIAGGGAKVAKEIAGRSAHICAVVLIAVVGGEIAEFPSRNGLRILLRTAGERVGGEETLFGIEAVLTVVGFTAGDLVIPVLAGVEVPATVGLEDMQCVALVEAG